MRSEWNYGDAYKRHDMGGIVSIGGGRIKVHNIFDELPEFMLEADCIFCDPPCSRANINAFYTKAGRSDYQESFEPFTNRLFECIRAVSPKQVFIEVFKSNRERFTDELKGIFRTVMEYESFYYNNRKNRCWILHAHNQGCEIRHEIGGIDEEKAIAYICENVKFDCIGDFCMGQGLVAKYAARFGRRFVGTELNGKRLAVAVERVEKELEKKEN